ncbi:hypothetical protein BC826DRAFT_447065 [Russula brevipes]|nr:hypothetical protein BC826DRAFT_447065 [Russula brevipes]
MICDHNGTALSEKTLLDDFDLGGNVVMVCMCCLLGRLSCFPQLYRIPDLMLENPPFVMFSGTATDSNKPDGTFHLAVSQRTSSKQCHVSSLLTVSACFLPSRYKLKRPQPSDGTCVVVDGLLTVLEKPVANTRRRHLQGPNGNGLSVYSSFLSIGIKALVLVKASQVYLTRDYTLIVVDYC